jgi:hypothetical protein
MKIIKCPRRISGGTPSYVQDEKDNVSIKVFIMTFRNVSAIS